MIKVWAVEYGEYDDWDIQALFSHKEDTESLVQEMRRNKGYPNNTAHIDEWAIFESFVEYKDGG